MPNKFHSKYVCFGGQKTREGREICPKIRLFGFPDVLVTRSAATAARKVVSSFGPFEFERALTSLRPIWGRKTLFQMR